MKYTFFVGLSLLIASQGFAEMPSWSFSASGIVRASDPGWGLTVTTPYFGGHSAFAFRSSFLNRQDRLSHEGDYEHFGYTIYETQYLAGTSITDHFRAYSMFGLGLLSPNSSLSSQMSLVSSVNIGLEYEPYPKSNLAMFTELGQSLSFGTVAENAVGKPSYGTGLVGMVGFKAYLN